MAYLKKVKYLPSAPEIFLLPSGGLLAHTADMHRVLRFAHILAVFGLTAATLEAKETRDINVDTVTVTKDALSPLGAPILWKSIHRQGPVVGLPLAWDLADAETIALRRLRVEARLRASEAEVKIVLSLLNTTGKERKVKMAMPIAYESRQDGVGPLMEEMWGKGVTTVMDGGRQDLIERSRISATRVAVDDREVNYEFAQGTHPLKDAPSMGMMRDIRDWLIFPVEFKGNQELLVEVKVILPYSQDFTIEKNRETISPARLKFLMGSGATWLDRLHWGTIGLDPQEMRETRLNITNPQGYKLGKKQDGWYDWTITSETLAMKEPMCIELSPGIRVEKSGDKVSVTAAGVGTGTVYDQYEAKASSVLEGTHPDTLKVSEGGWAEGVSDDGKNEWVELALSQPKPLLGIILVNGRSPAHMGEEEQKHPDLSHTFYGLPKKIQVTLNGTYTFPVTLREDWNTQFIIPPYFSKPVKSIRVSLDTVRGGKVSSDTWLSQILPVAR